MSFSDIAEAAGVPRGNLYYYFKTKDEVLAAVIAYRLRQMREMLHQWDESICTPLERLKRYCQIPVNEQVNASRYGCPMGSLNSELGKSQLNLQALSRQQLDLFKDWLIKQFRLLVPEKNAEHLAMHILVCTQGIALMSQTYADQDLVVREIERLNAWLDHVSV